MRKSYLIILALFIGVSAFGQRSVDWSVESILKPTEITSTTSAPTQFDIEAVFKNNGPDDVMSGDTIAYQFAFLRSSGQPYFVYPAQGLGVASITRAVANGDTMHFHLRLSYPQYTIQSQNTTLRLSSVVINRSGSAGVADEAQGTQPNNIATKAVIWYNPQGWGVGIDDVEIADVNLYPNPAQDQITLKYNLVNVTEESTIEVFDLQGKKIIDQKVAAGSTQDTVDVSALEAGMYVVRVKNGSFTTEKKFTVTR